jgi:integrase
MNKTNQLFALRDSISFAEWAVHWLNTYCKNFTRRVAEERQRFVHGRLIPRFGGMQLPEVGAEDIRGLLDSWIAEGAMANTVRQRYFTVKGLFGDACRERMISRNPCADVLPPYREARAFVWTEEALREQVLHLERGPCKDVGLLVIGSGLRPVELYDILTDNFDRDQRTLRIRYRGRYVIVPREPVLPQFAADAVVRLLDEARNKMSRFLWSMKNGRKCGRGHFDQMMRDQFPVGGARPPTIHCTDLRRALTFLGRKAGVSSSLISYYMQMRRAEAPPTRLQLVTAADLLDAAFRELF